MDSLNIQSYNIYNSNIINKRNITCIRNKSNFSIMSPRVFLSFSTFYSGLYFDAGAQKFYSYFSDLTWILRSCNIASNCS